MRGANCTFSHRTSSATKAVVSMLLWNTGTPFSRASFRMPSLTFKFRQKMMHGTP